MFIFDPPPSAIVIPTSIVIGTPVTGGTVFGILWENAAGNLASGPATMSATGVITAPAFIATGGTITSNIPALAATQTWNSGGTTFSGISLNVVNTASAGASLLLNLQNNSTSVMSVDVSGNTSAAGYLRSATNIQISGTGFFGSTSKTLLATGVTDGVLGLSKNDGATGVSLDFSTTAVVKVRNYANSADGTLKAILQTSASATTGLTPGVLSATTNASIVITDGSGQVYRVPCII